jgi:hypothetical protein
VTCSSYSYLDKAPSSTALVTIFASLEKNILCFDCSVENYKTEAIVKVTDIDFKMGVCLYEGNECKYNQYFD